MKNEIEKILKEYTDGRQTLQDATAQVLLLFSVSKRRELLIDFCDRVILKEKGIHIHTDRINEYLKTKEAREFLNQQREKKRK